MAGAVSAGAYTAGVIDYLLETLERWEQAKASGDPSIPRHRVKLCLLSGASAGGMTAIISSRALQDKIIFLDPDKREDSYESQKLLFDAWVNLTEDPSKDMVHQLLDISDLTEGMPKSLLNGNFIKTLAENVLATPLAKPLSPAYVADDLDILVTLSNLDGIDVEQQFSSAGTSQSRSVAKGITTRKHLDFAHFSLSANGYQQDGRIPIDYRQKLEEPSELTILKNAAMATGAFPIGLPARELKRQKKYLDDNHIIAQFLGGKPSSTNETSTIVDGGMLYNEPYEISKAILDHRVKKENNLAEVPAPGHETFCSTVLLIDPFPAQVEPDPRVSVIKTDVVGIAMKLLSVLRSSSLFPGEFLSKVMQGLDRNDYSAFMIAPSRNDNDRDIRGDKAIASGSLAGFGGFFSKEFRRHDYYLGRRNCQRFLSQYFTVPENTTNPIFQDAYSQEARDRFSPQNEGERRTIPIIPDTNWTGSAWEKEEEQLPFPEYNLSDLNNYREAVYGRIWRLMAALLPGRILGLVRFGAYLLYKRKAFDFLSRMIKGQLEDWKLAKAKPSGHRAE